MHRANQPTAHLQQSALLITHRQRKPVGPAPTAQFEWYLCPQVGAFSHLVLLDAHCLLGHWVLPAVGSSPAEPTAGVWMQVLPDAELARPAAHEASCQGTGAAIGRAEAAPHELVLHLPTANGRRRAYWLRQLRPGSPSWLLSRERPHHGQC